MQTKLLTLLLLTLLLITPLTTAKELQTIDLTATIEKEGNSSIIETYTFILDTEEETDTFVESIGAFGANTTLWTLYDENLNLHFGTPDTTFNKNASAKLENNNGIIQFNYQVNDLAYSTILPGGEIWELNNEQLNLPVQSGLLEITENTIVTINLPENAEVHEVAPQAQITPKTIIWQGPTVANRLVLKYELKQVLVPSAAIQLPLPKTDQTTNIILLIIVLIIATLATLQRENIKNKLDKYIIVHSTVTPDKYQESVLEQES